MEGELLQIENELKNSTGEWRWHVAQVISEVPVGYLVTYGKIAEIVNQRFGHNIIAWNVAWLRGELYGLLELGHDTQVPLHRIAKAGDVDSLADSETTKRKNDELRGQEGSLHNPKWWDPKQ